MPPERIFYDGDCGLCHGVVKVLVRLDRSGEAFRFAPLGGPTFLQLVPPERRAGLPDSIIVVTGKGDLLARSRAIAYLLDRLGGVWRGAAVLIRLFPGALADLAYDGVARARRRLFRRPEEACPLLPPRLRTRFDP